MTSIPLSWLFVSVLADVASYWHGRWPGVTHIAGGGSLTGLHDDGRRQDWTPAAVDYTFPDGCPADTTTQTAFFGATSMLGKFMIKSFRDDSPGTCIINFGRSKCPQCHINVKGDMRDTAHIRRAFEYYDIETVVTAVKPPLLGIPYKMYIELNFFAMVELTKVAKASGTKNFIMVSSIAASSHYIHHQMATEEHPQPLLTEYEAPYDASKRLGEDFLLSQHSDEFRTISIRTSGIIGGDGDPYDIYRVPFVVPSFGIPFTIDANFAGNIGDALVVVDNTLKKNGSLGGQFYYYTGEHNSEDVVGGIVAEATGKVIVGVPFAMLQQIIAVWEWARWDWTEYNTLDLVRMAVVEQTFDQTKFHTAFPDFKPKVTMREALMQLYGGKGVW